MPEKTEGLSPPEQSEEARTTNLEHSPGGLNTATGLEKHNESGEYEEPDERGSTTPIAGGEPNPDYGKTKSGKPSGAQAIPAAFSTNGSQPLTRIATPTGPQPVSAVARTPEEAEHLLRQAREREEASVMARARGRTEISEAKLGVMSAAEIRAVAHDRGYSLPDHTSHGLATRLFLEKQSEDRYIEGQDTPDEEDSENTENT